MMPERSLALLGATTLAGVALVSQPALAADWPQWFGQQRDGQSPEKGIITGWPKTEEGPKVLFRAKPGKGLSSVSVSKGTLYTMSAKATSEFVLAVDARSGQERWRHRLDEMLEDSMGDDGPRATPTVAGDKVVTLGARGKLVALEAATGKELWTRHLVDEIGGKQPRWGYCASPLVVDQRVFVDPGGSEGRGLAAFDLGSGQVVWKAGDYEAGYSSPIHTTIHGIEQILFFAGEAAVAVEPATGKEIWSRVWKTSYNVNAATPLMIAPDRVFIASGYGVGSAVLHITPTPRGLAAADVWKKKVLRNKMATSVLVGGTLYGHDESRLQAIDPATGEQHWKEKGWGRGTLIAADDHLIVLGEDCALGLVEATPKGYELVRGPHQVLNGEQCWTSPALANGVLYVRDPEQLIALEVGTR